LSAGGKKSWASERLSSIAIIMRCDTGDHRRHMDDYHRAWANACYRGLGWHGVIVRRPD